MSLVAAVALVLAAGVLLTGGRRRPALRLNRLRVGYPGHPGHPGHPGYPGEPAPAVTPRESRPYLLLRLAPPLVGLAGWALIGGWAGSVVGPLAGLGAWAAIRRLSSPGVTRERREAAEELPYGVDLLAAALRAGAPVDRALTVVGAALGGPLGRRFDAVGRALRLGVHGVQGWDAMSDVPGARSLIVAAARAAQSGAALAAACSRAAGELREQRAAAADAAAQRASIWIVLPLGACFLPAFVLVGVVPILLGVLDDVLA